MSESDGTFNGIWPDFIAPSKYVAPDPRWEDPGLPDFRLIWKIARTCGYSIGLHGSMKRDCDLIAAPWTVDAVSAVDLIDRLCEGLDAFILGGQSPEPVLKPHGRLAWCLQIRDAYKKVLDVSVMPTALGPIAALLPDAIAAAEKAMQKYPQPNYVISKWAEETGEVTKAAIHMAEGRDTPENLRGEIVQSLAMLHRLLIEGDQVHGLPPLAGLFHSSTDGGAA